MRRSRDSLDTILHEREEGVGAESPVGDLSRDARPQAENYVGSTPNKPAYGFKIALVAASRKDEKLTNVVTVGLPVGERDGDPEGCSSLDEQQLGVLSKHEELSGGRGSESGAVRNQEREGTIVLEDQKGSVAVENRLSEANSESGISDSGLDQVYQGERVVVPVSNCEAVDGTAEKASATQDTHLPDRKEQFTEVRLLSADKTCVTNEHLTDGEQLSRAVEGKLDHADETGIQESLAESASVAYSQEQETKTEDVNETDANQHSVDRLESNAIDETSKSDHIGETKSQETLTENASVTDSKQQTSETEDVNENDTNHSFDREETNAIDEPRKSDHIGETESQEILTENASVTDSKQQTSETEDVNENDTDHYSFDREETNTIDEPRKSDHIGETEAQEALTESTSVSNSPGQKSEDEAEQHYAK